MILSELACFFPQKTNTLLFRHVDDVDAFIGINLEDKIPGGIVGPTAACIIGRQFKALRDGDRLFYSHSDVLTTGASSPLTLTNRKRISCFLIPFSGTPIREKLSTSLFDLQDSEHSASA